MSQDHKETDEFTGVETTGHEWDCIKELNNPLPKWWIYTFYVTVIWAIGYWIAMPAFPLVSDYTKGLLGRSQRQVVAEQVATAQANRAQFSERLMSLPLAQIKNDAEMMNFAMAAAEAAFGDNCATCHGSGAQGFKGYPNLNDDDWIWGGTLEEIQQTLEHGVRSESEETRYSDMPAFVKEGLLDRDQALQVVEYVLSLSNQEHDKTAAAQGKELFAQECASCHGDNGKGDKELGAPNLTDAIWLHSGTREGIYDSIAEMKGGVMPAWKGRLDDSTLRSLAIYVHSLGGGQ